MCQDVLKSLIERSGALAIRGTEQPEELVATNLAQNNDSSEESGEEDRDSYLEKLQTKSRFQRSISNFFSERMKNIHPSERCISFARCIPFRNYVGPNEHTTPRYDIVIWNLISLIFFFGMLCPATHYPTESMAIAFISVSGFMFTALLVSVILDLTNHGKS